MLRGFTALLVVLSHFLPFWARYCGSLPVIVPNEWGGDAVKLFFVISGFVIFMTLDKCSSVADFAVLRFSRLYPTYWTTLTVATVVSVFVFGEQFWLGGFVVNATMFQEFLGYPNADNVYWSLTVELAFYLMAAGLLAMGLHRRPLVIATIWLAASIIWALALERPDDALQRDWFSLLFALDFSPYFTIGIVLFHATKRGYSWHHAGVIALALVTVLAIEGWVGFGVASTSALLLALAVRGQLRFLVGSVTLWLGSISYPLYLVHRNLGYETLRWLHAHHIGAAVAIPIAILGSVALATTLTFGVEKPALRRIRRWYEAWRARGTGKLALTPTTGPSVEATDMHRS